MNCWWFAFNISSFVICPLCTAGPESHDLQSCFSKLFHFTWQTKNQFSKRLLNHLLSQIIITITISMIFFGEAVGFCRQPARPAICQVGLTLRFWLAHNLRLPLDFYMNTQTILPSQSCKNEPWDCGWSFQDANSTIKFIIHMWNFMLLKYIDPTCNSKP